MPAFMQGQPRPPMTQPANTGSPEQHPPQWGAWFTNAHQVLKDVSTSDITANRPITQLYVGKFFFDVTLGIPIWLKTPPSGASAAVWVNATGAAV